ncbi:hypothetical protein P20652_2357 [Pseudoalteromonas sp. BSi20652]|nr:hypothetical protein P20652_2357 [Pseudoalteromonas sp. BSi20652]
MIRIDAVTIGSRALKRLNNTVSIKLLFFGTTSMLKIA